MFLLYLQIFMIISCVFCLKISLSTPKIKPILLCLWFLFFLLFVCVLCFYSSPLYSWTIPHLTKLFQLHGGCSHMELNGNFSSTVFVPKVSSLNWINTLASNTMVKVFMGKNIKGKKLELQENAYLCWILCNMINNELQINLLNLIDNK